MAVTKYHYHAISIPCVYNHILKAKRMIKYWGKRMRNERKGKGMKEKHSIAFMYNSNSIYLPLWLIAISKGHLPLYWIWGKCCWNLIEQHCVVSPWGSPLFIVLQSWLCACVCVISAFLFLPLLSFILGLCVGSWQTFFFVKLQSSQ